MADDVCTICSDSLQKVDDQSKPMKIKLVKQKGLNTFIQNSQIIQDGKAAHWHGKSEVRFHETCRKRYSNILRDSDTNIKRRKILDSSISSSDSSISSLSESPNSSRIEDTSDFNHRELCFFCALKLDESHKKVHTLRKIDLDELRRSALEKQNDIGDRIYRRISGVQDSCITRLRYHAQCYQLFKKSKSPEPTQEPSVPADAVRVDESSNEIQYSREDEIFELICAHIEDSEKCVFTLNGLRTLNNDDVLSNYILERKLIDRYGERVFFKKVKGKPTKVCFKNLNLDNIYNFWLNDEDSLSIKEKRWLADIVIKFLRKDVFGSTYDNTSYPPPSQMLRHISDDVPQSLNYFLENFLKTKNEAVKRPDDEESIDKTRKKNTIAHGMITTIRPRAFLSKQHLAVSTYVHKKTGCKLAVDLLASLGLSCSYHLMQMYEAAVIMNAPKRMIANGTRVQSVSDNTDFNKKTLNGHNTLHYTGNIALYTPDHGVTYEGLCGKLKMRPKASELASKSAIDLKQCNIHITSDVLEMIEFVDINSLCISDPATLPHHYTTYLLGKTLDIEGLPVFRGFMTKLCEEDEVTKSHVVYLPFIKHQSSQLSTLYTAIFHAMDLARELNQKVTIVTFDQPLYHKARLIVAALEKLGYPKILVRLGGFHLLMSYMGAICYIMDGSGIEDMWCTAYAQDSIRGMLTGHFYARALRAHILSFTAIGNKLCKILDLSDEIQSQIRKFFENWDTHSSSQNAMQIDDCKNELIEPITSLLVEKMEALEDSNPTAKLWILYFKSVTVALQFIEAHRRGNWNLLLQSMKSMLPLLHASGHLAYAKSLQIHLQDLANLELLMTDDDEFRDFTERGMFTVHLTDQVFAGMFSDQVIEVTLNRFFGTELKHGRGVSPGVLARFIAAMPATCMIMQALEEYCGIKSISSEQHTELGPGRISTDNEDLRKFEYWLNGHDPFAPRSSLVSLSTGLIAGPEINCHKAVEEGLKAMSLMVGKNLNNLSLSLKNKVKPISTAKDGKRVMSDMFSGIDHSLLLERISLALRDDEDETKHALKYELAPWPMSMFDQNGMMRKSKKSDLYKHFETSLLSELDESRCIYVLDGGWLLHFLSWPHCSKFEDIFALYRNYIVKNYRRDAIVIFDGYSSEIIGTKSYERYRRKEKNVGADIEIGEDHILTLNQKQFLSNIANKFKFVQKLAEYLRRYGMKVEVATEDADSVIVNTAIAEKRAHNAPVSIVGNDVDLLVLAIALTDDEEIFLLKKTPGKTPLTLYSTRGNKSMKDYILFAHAFSGCDSTNALFNQGKLQIMKLLRDDKGLRELVAIFKDPRVCKELLLEISKEVVVRLYNSKKYNLDNPTIEDLRYEIFKSSPAKKDLLAYLPPTESALQQHANRVYCQIQMWLGHDIDPEDWGWLRTDLMLLPIMNNKAAAPEKLLEQVFCKCRGDCSSSSRCICRKAGLRCSNRCGYCNGQSCENAQEREPICFDEDEQDNGYSDTDDE